MVGDRLFQARAAAMGNARLPSVERLVGLTTGVGELALHTLSLMWRERN